ncbi:hypothetical protein IC582_030148 [Cucumis melo]
MRTNMVFETPEAKMPKKKERKQVSSCYMYCCIYIAYITYDVHMYLCIYIGDDSLNYICL